MMSEIDGEPPNETFESIINSRWKPEYFSGDIRRLLKFERLEITAAGMFDELYDRAASGTEEVAVQSEDLSFTLDLYRIRRPSSDLQDIPTSRYFRRLTLWRVTPGGEVMRQSSFKDFIRPELVVDESTPTPQYRCLLESRLIWEELNEPIIAKVLRREQQLYMRFLALGLKAL